MRTKQYGKYTKNPDVFFNRATGEAERWYRHPSMPTHCLTIWVNRKPIQGEWFKDGQSHGFATKVVVKECLLGISGEEIT